jgi:transcriptional regulator with XRE-family HTH domain
MKQMEFKDWIAQKYREWSRGKKSETQFAIYLGVSQATMNAWINGSRGLPKSAKIIRSLADKLGPEIYEIIGLQRPPEPPDLRDQLIEAGFPSNFVDELLRTREAYTLELESKGIKTDSPEAKQIVNEALSKLAAKLINIEILSEEKSS